MIIAEKKFLFAGGIPGAILIFRPVLILLISRGRDPNQYDALDSSALIQIFYTLVVFLVGIYFLANNRLSQQILFKTPLKYLFWYSLLGILSSTWSINWEVSLYRGFENLAYQLLVVALLTKLSFSLYHQNENRVVSWIMTYAAIVIAISVFRRSQWAGISFQVLFSEQFNSTPFFFIALFYPTVWYVRSLILSASIFSQSNTAYAGMIIGSLSFIRGKKWMKAMFFISSIVLLCFIIWLGLENILQNTIFYGKEGVGFEYTTGRDIIFNKSIKYILDSPILGYGFVAPEIELVTQGQIGIIGVHNALLSSLLGMGIPGLLLIMLFFAELFKLAGSKRYLNSTQRAAFTGTIFIGLFHSVANPGIGSRMYGTWLPVVILFTLISTVYIVQKNRQSKQRSQLF